MMRDVKVKVSCWNSSFCPLRLDIEVVFCASTLISPAAEHAAERFIITQANLDATQGRRSVSRPKVLKVRPAVIGQDRP